MSFLDNLVVSQYQFEIVKMIYVSKYCNRHLKAAYANYLFAQQRAFNEPFVTNKIVKCIDNFTMSEHYCS